MRSLVLSAALAHHQMLSSQLAAGHSRPQWQVTVLQFETLSTAHVDVHVDVSTPPPPSHSSHCSSSTQDRSVWLNRCIAGKAAATAVWRRWGKHEGCHGYKPAIHSLAGTWGGGPGHAINRENHCQKCYENRSVHMATIGAVQLIQVHLENSR